MKTTYLLLAMIMLLPNVLAQLEQDEFHPFYKINYTCKDTICVEGQPILWTIHFSNSGGQPVEYTAFEFIDAFNYSPIMEYSIPYHPLRDYRGDIFVSWPNRESTINISAVVPASIEKADTVFYPCFTTTIDDIHVFVRHNDYVFRQCYDDNWTLPSVQCINSFHCAADQYCSGNRCYDLECESCQFISNHSCHDYECCRSEDCSFDQVCAGNSCVDLSCQETEYLFNRTCKQLNCNFDESILNNSCRLLDCAANEYVFNHSCKPLYCNDNEYVLNHTCRPCEYDQHLENGLCVPFTCRQNQAYSNHACASLECRFFQMVGQHKCVMNARAIIKLALESVIIGAIVTFAVLDIRKRRAMPKKQINQDKLIIKNEKMKK